MTKNLMIAIGLAALAFTACVSTTKTSERGIASFNPADENSTDFADSRPARPLSSAELAQWASSSKLKLTEARVIIDNDAAFDSKLAMIKRARKSIRMSYFIYGDDDSSALISQALIDQAKAGVKVKLLVDFITNYSKLDHFQMMANEGGPNLQIHFYNFPSKPIFDDAKYMTLPCPSTGPSKTDYKACENYKAPMMAALANQLSTPFSRMFLSGMYGHGGTAMKVAMGYGAGIDKNKEMAEIKGLSKQQDAVIFDFFKLMKKAKAGDLSAKLKISAALTSNGATLNPILDEMMGRLPINDQQGVGHLNHSELWEHLTDYTHHKLVAIDGEEFQLGGRNIEDSYHMKSRLGSKGKYIFMDTDFYGRTVPGGASEVEVAFDKLANFDDSGKVTNNQMIADINKVQQQLPIDIVENPEALMNATGLCLQQVQKGQVQMAALGQCIENGISKLPMYKSRDARLAAAKKELEDSYVRYTTKYQGTKLKTISQNWRGQEYSPGVDNLSASDLAKAEVYYLENVTFDRHATGELQRQNGARAGAEVKFNKNIHAAWYRGMENACYVSQKTQTEKRVILHSAYLFLPSSLIHVLAKMITGEFGDCSKVHITLLTNSMLTTDLNVINVLARYQMSALFKFYRDYAWQRENDKNVKLDAPWLEYYEYKTPSSGTGISLHTKLSVLGDDMIVGSANADIRSYYMDTNNGVYIRNAPDLIKNYTAFVDEILKNPAKSHGDYDYYIRVTDEQLKTGMGNPYFDNTYPSNVMILTGMKVKWDKNHKLDAKREKEILDHVAGIGADVFNDTNSLLRYRLKWGHFQPDEASQVTYETEMNKLANQFDSFFKTL